MGVRIEKERFFFCTSYVWLLLAMTVFAAFSFYVYKKEGLEHPLCWGFGGASLIVAAGSAFNCINPSTRWKWLVKWGAGPEGLYVKSPGSSQLELYPWSEVQKITLIGLADGWDNRDHTSTRYMRMIFFEVRKQHVPRDVMGKITLLLGRLGRKTFEVNDDTIVSDYMGANQHETVRLLRRFAPKSVHVVTKDRGKP